MFKYSFNNFKLNFNKLTSTFPNSKTTTKSISNFKLKSIAIPSIMMSGYLFYNSKKYFTTKKSILNELPIRKFYIDNCDSLEEGQMKEVKFGPGEDDSLLVIKYNNELRVLSNFCPHFGAPLHTGILIDNVLKCPWHGASFDITTGKTDISPAMNDLIKYDVKNEDGKYYIELPEKNEQVTHSVHPKMSKRDPNDKRRFIIIGGGPAGLSAAETLRQAGYTGEITILSKDRDIPYDRTGLSKYFPDDVTKVYLRDPKFLKEYDIDIVTEVNVTSLDNKNKVIKSSDGKEYNYDKLLLASGGSPTILNIPGYDISNVYTLRTFTDLEKIKSACKDAKNIIIVGTGFIGMEAACLLKKSFVNANVTVIGKDEIPFYMTLGKEVGGIFLK